MRFWLLLAVAFIEKTKTWGLARCWWISGCFWWVLVRFWSRSGRYLVASGRYCRGSGRVLVAFGDSRRVLVGFW